MKCARCPSKLGRTEFGSECTWWGMSPGAGWVEKRGRVCNACLIEIRKSREGNSPRRTVKLVSMDIKRATEEAAEIAVNTEFKKECIEQAEVVIRGMKVTFTPGEVRMLSGILKTRPRSEFEHMVRTLTASKKSAVVSKLSKAEIKAINSEKLKP